MDSEKDGFVELDDEDYSVLFPEVSVMVGKKTLMISPLSLTDTAKMLTILRADWPTLVEDLAAKGIIFDKMTNQDMVGLSEVLVHRAPMVLSIMTGLHPGSVGKLPFVKIAELFNAAIKINMQDQDFFEVLSAIKESVDHFTVMMAGGEIKRNANDASSSSRKRFNGSSATGTDGQT